MRNRKVILKTLATKNVECRQFGLVENGLFVFANRHRLAQPDSKLMTLRNSSASLKTPPTFLFWRRERVEVKKTKVFRDALQLKIEPKDVRYFFTAEAPRREEKRNDSW